MSKMIQVRDVPDALHRELMRRARSRGETLTQYIEGLLRREVARPPAEEVFERVRARRSVDVPGPVAELIREERTLREIS